MLKKALKRKPSRKGLILKLNSLYRQIIRLRDKHICQHCGKHVTGADEHVSHVVPVSAGNKLRWDLSNAKIMCFHCHINWWHKNPIESGDWFKAKFPERAKYLEANKGTAIYKQFHLELLKDNLTKVLEELNGRSL